MAKVDPESIRMRRALLQKYLEHKALFELQALYALQSLVCKLEHPPGEWNGAGFVLVISSIWLVVISASVRAQWEQGLVSVQLDVPVYGIFRELKTVIGDNCNDALVRGVSGALGGCLKVCSFKIGVGHDTIILIIKKSEIIYFKLYEPIGLGLSVLFISWQESWPLI